MSVCAEAFYWRNGKSFNTEGTEKKMRKAENSEDEKNERRATDSI